MSIRTLAADSTIDAVRDALIYTEVRLTIAAGQEALAPSFMALAQRLDALEAERRGLYRAEVIGRAQVAAMNAIVDQLTRRIADRMAAVVQRNWDDPRWNRYFPQGAAIVIRMGLESQLRQVRTWPTLLAEEGDQELAALGAELRTVQEQGQAAVDARISAETALASWRIRQWEPFMADVNAARRSLFGVLTTRGAEQGLPIDWARSFFALD